MSVAVANPKRTSSEIVSIPHVILVALGIVVGLQLHLVFVKTINWDELWHYSLITASVRGEEVQFLQTPFVPLFSWVTHLAIPTLDQIIFIRTFILVFQVVTVWGIYVAARRFASVHVSLLCGLTYLTAGYAFTNGFALRADVIAAALLMSALALGLRGRVNLINCGLLFALLVLAVLSTIKSVLWAPCFLGAILLRKRELSIRPSRGLKIAGAAIVCFALSTFFFIFGGETADYVSETLTSSAQRMFTAGLFPQGRYLLKQVLLAPLFALLVIVFIVWLIRGEGTKSTKLTLALLAAPLLSVAFYRNAFPYYFTFLLPPVAIALAPVIEQVAKRYGTVGVCAMLTLNAVALWFAEPREPLGDQRLFQQQLRAVFPEPVYFIDECGVLGDYPRAVLGFASGWALSDYLAEGRPLYSRALEENPVPLLIKNSLALHNVFAADPKGDRLLPEDEKTLRNNFIEHSGMIYVAGKTIPAQSSLVDEYVAVPGLYSVEVNALTIDEKVYPVGTQVNLERARYSIVNSGQGSASLRWAKAGKPTASNLTVSDLFTDY
ncbi:MAG: hypothetical protein QNI87_00515 [Erythrobacter sp.]|uniref:hypothetical protein n=1 Tax=Erythrobacter sp. TaxID=1042 RepID=UPI00262C4648|nr:hypothetical protein [Erythrobacter sp.]MDJ0976999.1 hypothetical protein [Erythrobacter sp.]